MKLRLLFVDDEPQMLHLIGQLLEPMQTEWELAFATGGREALTLLEARPMDVVISDMRMPSMSGAELFAQVQARAPRAVRIILSGYADHAQVMQAVGVAHQFLTKPLVLRSLMDTLERIQELSPWLRNDRLRDLMGRMTNLPSLPTVYFRILEALRSADSSIEEIAEIISADPALTAKVLQVVNSAFFGFARTILSAGEATQLLGMNRIRLLALTAHVFSAFDSARNAGIPLEDIWLHSLRTGTLAQKTARAETREPAFLEQCFTAGTLHDIGKLILAANLPEQYHEVLTRAHSGGLSLPDAEQEAFGSNHAEVGAYLLGVWGLPVPLVEAVALHHEPTRARSRALSPLTAVHVANVLARGKNSRAHSRVEIDAEYLRELGLPDSISDWQRTVSERGTILAEEPALAE